jgi:hypothetical protein
MGRHAFLSRTCMGFAVLALLALVAPPARPAGPAKLYPEFESRKSGLGSLALVADVVVVEDVSGTTEKVYREDSKEVGRRLMDQLAEGLGSKGYSFASRTLVSVGNVVTGKYQYRVLDRWEQRTEDDSRFAVQSPPFYRDSTLCASDSACGAWHALLNGVWEFQKKRKEPAGTLGSITSLRGAIGTDFALVVVVVATRATLGKQLGQHALAGIPIFGKSDHKLEFESRDAVRFSPDVDFTKYSGTGLKLAVVDCRSGEVLWSDADHDRWGFEEDRLNLLVKQMIKLMI